MVKGTCKECQGKVTRIIEFGEDQDFFNKANNFRKSIKG
jgi:DNA polymerase II large subunit